eukprot:247996_1
MTPFLSNVHKMKSSILLLIVVLFRVQITASQNITNNTDYKIFQLAVCNQSHPYYDDCSCRLAKWSTIGEYEAKFECFNQFNIVIKIPQILCAVHGIQAIIIANNKPKIIGSIWSSFKFFSS